MLKDIILQRNFFPLAWRAGLWHLKYALHRAARPLACGFYITSRCNFRCEFCNIWRMEPGFQSPLEEAKAVINELGKMGVAYFSFSGGEPLLVPYLFDLLAYAKEAGILYTHIVSNGYLMDAGKAGMLQDAGVSEISFSLDGEEKAHDKRRGMAGAFQGVMRAVDYVKTYAPETKVVLNAILDPLHPEGALFAVNTAQSLQVKIKVQPANEHPDFGMRDCALKSRRPLQSDEKQRLLDAISAMQKSPYLANSRPFLENYKAFVLSPQRRMFLKDGCIFGYHHIEFFANQVFPCIEGFGWKDGFALSGRPVKEILASSPYRDKLKQLKRCPSCAKSYYVCYYEPRLNFPVWNLLKSRLR